MAMNELAAERCGRAPKAESDKRDKGDAKPVIRMPVGDRWTPEQRALHARIIAGISLITSEIVIE
jgi:hypothetical protein